MPAAMADGSGPGEPPRPQPQETRRTYRPTVTPAGEVLVAGCSLGTVERGPDGQPVLVLRDRCRPRSQARGTDRPAVCIEDLAAAVRGAVGDKGEG
jgi:hypothetical protein